MLAHLAERLQAATFEEVVGGACGRVVKAIVDICIIVYTFGTCIAFLVVIGDQLQDCEFLASGGLFESVAHSTPCTQCLQLCTFMGRQYQVTGG